MEGFTERTHPVQPGTSSYEARWGPSRASAALPGLQALRAHIWNNFSLCIVINHDIFQKKAKTRFIETVFERLWLHFIKTVQLYNNSTSTLIGMIWIFFLTSFRLSWKLALSFVLQQQKWEPWRKHSASLVKVASMEKIGIPGINPLYCSLSSVAEKSVNSK